MYFNIAISILD